MVTAVAAGVANEGLLAWLTPDGHYRSVGERELVCVIELPDGRQETLTPAEFTKRFGWQNDPNRVRLAP